MVCGIVHYMSCAANGGRNTLDFNKNLNLIAYAAYRKVVLYDPEKLHITGTSKEAHKALITHVFWLKSCAGNDCGFLLTASNDGCARLWFVADDEVGDENTNVAVRMNLRLLVTLEGHKSSISACCGLYLPSKGSDLGKIFVATSSDDQVVKAVMVEADTGEYTEVGNHTLRGRSLVLCSHLFMPHYNQPVRPSSTSIVRPQSRNPLLILGGDDAKVHIYSFHDNVCERVCLLSGHEDWITSLDSRIEENGDTILGSGSKDGSIRLWRISKKFDPAESELLYNKPIKITITIRRRSDSTHNELQKVDSTYSDSLELFCSLESVLIGHDGFISKIEWIGQSYQNSLPRILSCAQTEDRSIIVWKEEALSDCPSISDLTNVNHQENSEDSKYLQKSDVAVAESVFNGISSNKNEANSSDTISITNGEVTGESSKIWVEETRLGEVGGNREGFFNASFGPDGKSIVATSYQGGIHLWKFSSDGQWVTKPAVNGHFKEVVDLAWSCDGSYLLTTSKDQTTRMHVQKKNIASEEHSDKDNKIYNKQVNNNAQTEKFEGNIDNNAEELSQNREKTIIHDEKLDENSLHFSNDDFGWCELSRPQVHGFDLTSISSIGEFKFISGAEEKVLRIFDAPKHVINLLASVTGQVFQESDVGFDSASVPSLGLSNKAVTIVNNVDKNKELQELNGNITPKKLIQPPNESQLMLSTLWPEVSKLYGHGNEILSVAANRDGSHVASSCRASNPQDANILIFDTSSGKVVCSLPHHRLSVTQLSFYPSFSQSMLKQTCSPVGDKSTSPSYLLSASRDRNWAVFKQEGEAYSLVCSSSDMTKKQQHTRVIWSVCWFGDGSRRFITGSRDKTAVIWKPIYEETGKDDKSAVTALSKEISKTNINDKINLSSNTTSEDTLNLNIVDEEGFKLSNPGKDVPKLSNICEDNLKLRNTNDDAAKLSEGNQKQRNTSEDAAKQSNTNEDNLKSNNTNEDVPKVNTAIENTSNPNCATEETSNPNIEDNSKQINTTKEHSGLDTNTDDTSIGLLSNIEVGSKLSSMIENFSIQSDAKNTEFSKKSNAHESSESNSSKHFSKTAPKIVKWERESVSVESEEITAVDVYSVSIDASIVAIGTVKGTIILRQYSTSKNAFVDSTELLTHHQDTVRRLSFQTNSCGDLLLASCGDDYTTLIHKICI